MEHRTVKRRRNVARSKVQECFGISTPPCEVRVVEEDRRKDDASPKREPKPKTKPQSAGNSPVFDGDDLRVRSSHGGDSSSASFRRKAKAQRPSKGGIRRQELSACENKSCMLGLLPRLCSVGSAACEMLMAVSAIVRQHPCASVSMAIFLCVYIGLGLVDPESRQHSRVVYRTHERAETTSGSFWIPSSSSTTSVVHVMRPRPPVGAFVLKTVPKKRRQQASATVTCSSKAAAAGTCSSKSAEMHERGSQKPSRGLDHRVEGFEPTKSYARVEVSHAGSEGTTSASHVDAARYVTKTSSPASRGKRKAAR